MQYNFLYLVVRRNHEESATFAIFLPKEDKLNIFKKIDQVSKKLIKKKESNIFEFRNMQNAPTYFCLYSLVCADETLEKALEKS